MAETDFASIKRSASIGLSSRLVSAPDPFPIFFIRKKNWKRVWGRDYIAAGPRCLKSYHAINLGACAVARRVIYSNNNMHAGVWYTGTSIVWFLIYESKFTTV